MNATSDYTPLLAIIILVIFAYFIRQNFNLLKQSNHGNFLFSRVKQIPNPKDREYVQRLLEDFISFYEYKEDVA